MEVRTRDHTITQAIRQQITLRDFSLSYMLNTNRGGHMQVADQFRLTCFLH